MSLIRVLIADDHQLFRRNLRRACEVEDSFEVVGEAENGREAVELARCLQPDVILMDTKMPILDGVQATSIIAEENPAVCVILLAVHWQDSCFFTAIKAGAKGYLLKDGDEQTLCEAIRAVYQGEALLDSQLTARLLDEFRRLGQAVTKEKDGK